MSLYKGCSGSLKTFAVFFVSMSLAQRIVHKKTVICDLYVV